MIFNSLFSGFESHHYSSLEPFPELCHFLCPTSGQSGMDRSIENIEALLSALRYGPEAVRKIKELFGLKSDSSGTWPPGKTVKIQFQDEEVNGKDRKDPKIFQWKPESEYFHEVIMRQAAIGDFEVSYQDKDGDKVQLDATKPGIEAFLSDHNQHSSPKLLVEWRPPTTGETIQSTVKKAKNWLTGGGGATDQAVKAAQEKVEKEGGKITVSSGSGRSLVDHKGYRKEDWGEAVKGLALQMGLSKDEREAFQSAGLCEDGKAQHFREDIVGNKIVTQFSAYHIVRRADDKIDVVYGKHVESMEVSGGGTSLPSENCIQYNDTLFAVWPPGSPHSKTAASDMYGLTVEIPSGWQVVDSSQEGFDSIRQRVIAPYGWHTNRLLTSGPDGKLQGWYTPNWGNSPPGEQCSDKMEDLIEKKDESRFHFKGRSYRLLIQAHPSANHELVNNWKRYVQLSAQREWSQRLGMPQGPQGESLSRL